MNKRLFRAALAVAGYTQQQLAKELNMAESTIVRKVKRGSFTIEEANKIIKILNITQPQEIFFTNEVT